jgi:hypothetical protein
MKTSIASNQRSLSKVQVGRRRDQHYDRGTVRKVLLSCGIISSLWYVVMCIIVPMYFPGYRSASQVISELFAIGGPTRSLWVLLGVLYTLLVTAFGWGVWQSAGSNHPLRTAGALLIAYGALGLWPFAPMHLRETLAAGGATWSDTMHIALGVVNELLYLFAIGFATTALGKPFRLYCIVTFVILLLFGFLTFLDAPRISANLPKPLIGVWERINIGVFLLWVIVLAIVLLRRENKSAFLHEATRARHFV